MIGVRAVSAHKKQLFEANFFGCLVFHLPDVRDTVVKRVNVIHARVNEPLFLTLFLNKIRGHSRVNLEQQIGLVFDCFGCVLLR